MTFDGRTFNSVYATTNSVITFGAPDGTYWDYPQTPSISLYSFDWVVYPGARSDEHLIIRSSDGGFQVDISARPIWLQNATEPTNIVITAAILSDGTVAMAYTLNGPEYPEYNPRTGVRLNDGTVQTFEQYGIQETEEAPELAPEPTEEAPFNPPTPEPTPEPEPYLNAPTNLTAIQLEDGSVQLTWDAPIATSISVERYDISWSTDNFQNNSWGWNHDQTTINIPRDVLSQNGGLGNNFQFRIRADNNTSSIYSNYSNTSSLYITAPPVIPEGASVAQEGTFFEVVAPIGQRVANAVGYYGDPNDSTRGEEVSSILFELLSGETSATIEVSNETFANDPAPGTPKVLILLITYEDIPVDSTPVSEQPVAPEPSPLPEEEPVIEPSPEPTTVPPTKEPTPEPTPSQEPVEEPTENEPEPLPEPEPSSPSEKLRELTEIIPENLTNVQVEQLIAMAEEILATAEPGSEEYEQALDALFLAAQADDIVLDESLLAIPLLGNALDGAVELINFLGNVGSDMSPQVRETAEKIVVVSVVVTQVVAVTAIGAMASTSIRRP